MDADKEVLKTPAPEGVPPEAWAQTVRLREHLGSMQLLPMENVDGFMSYAELCLLPLRVLSATSTIECDAAQETFEDQRRLLLQLLASLATARKDLARENKNFKTATKKKEGEAANKAHAEQQQQQQVEAETLAKKQVEAHRDTKVFNLDWAGHRKLATHEVAAYQKLRSESPATVLDEPCIIRDAAKRDRINPAVKETMDRWMSAFPQTQICKKDNRTQAPVATSHNLGVLTDLLQKVSQEPGAFMLDGPLPALKNITKTPFFFGYSSIDVSFAFAPDYMGSAYYVYGGRWAC